MQVLVAGVVAGAVAGPAWGQATVTSVSPLAFGTILSGVTTTVAVTSAQAMAFRIDGKLGLAGGFTLTLPSTLSRVGGGASLPLTVCNTCGRYRLGVNDPSGATTFDPATGVSGLVILINTTLYIWIGGAVSPPLAQQAGSYSGTVVLTLAPIL